MDTSIQSGNKACTYANNTTDAYDSGRIFYQPQSKIVSKTGHHYAEQDGDRVRVYSLNNYDDLNSGFHESYNTEGTLRGLIIWNCCPYAVIEKDNGELVAFGFEMSRKNWLRSN